MFVAFAFFVAVPLASAQSVDEKIRELKEELTRLEGQQIELKKEATAAAATLPTFQYRPGSGLLIQSGDKSWAVRFQFEFDLHVYNHIDGEADPAGKGVTTSNPNDKYTSGDLFMRRVRPYFHYCWDDCFYIIRFGLDADTGEVIGTQTADLTINFSQMNPYFPDFYIANPGGQTGRYVSRSSTSSAAVETAQDMLSDSLAVNLGHRGVGLQWINAPLGTTGDFTFALEAAKPFFSSAGNDTVTATAIPSGSNENADNSDLYTFFLKAGMRPFNKMKNKWLEKTKLGFVWQTGAVSESWSATTRRLRIQSMDRVGRPTIFEARNIGSGMHNRLEYGIEWGVGPYLIRSANGLSSFEDKHPSWQANTPSSIGGAKGVHGAFWSVANELFLWSPKGFLTGSATTARSFQVGWRFTRSDATCGVLGCVQGIAANAPGSYKRAFLTNRELGAWFYIRPALRVGTWWNWWRSSNTPLAIQNAIGCDKSPTTNGKKCDWHSVNLGVAMTF